VHRKIPVGLQLTVTMPDNKRRIAELREKIDGLDHELLQRLEARARHSREIHELVQGEAVLPDVSETRWLEGWVERGSGDLPPESLRAIFSQIRAAGRALEQPTRVAYLGVEGGFSHRAARLYFGASAQFIESASAAELFEDVKRERAVFAVFPLESSSEGLMQANVSALAQTPLVLVGQREVEARFDLVSREARLDALKVVYLTPTADASCERFLDRELAGMRVEHVRSPLAAARLAAREAGTAALIPRGTVALLADPASLGGGSSRPGSSGSVPPPGSVPPADLVPLREDVGDTPDARIRFAIAGPRPAMRSGRDVTCVLFSVSDQPGALYDVLKHFAERNINLKRMQARPVREAVDYLFYVELEGHGTDRALATALEGVKRSTRYLKVLGSFPA
jgi:chorismate mutase/prephenate dehydratase